ncbi:hypothetical protein FRC12_000745 [Ceratobasidium sp. 428]|nr:hypothetical protein FRC12_000745 [Ceratobasidium sp. 428]
MSNNQNHHPNAAILPYFVATFEDYAVTIKRDTEYNTVIKYIQKSIPTLRSVNAQNIRISTTLAEYGDTLIRISEETWPDLVDSVKNAKIILDRPAETSDLSSNFCVGETKCLGPSSSRKLIASTITATNQAAQEAAPDLARKGPSDRFSIVMKTRSCSHFELDNTHRLSSIRSLKAQIEYESGTPAALQRLDLLGNTLDDVWTLEQAGITQKTTLDLVLSTRKSVVYCFAPHHGTQEQFTLSNVEVKCGSDRAWELVALASGGGSDRSHYSQSRRWKVDVAHDGAIWNRTSQTDFECLFWDGAPKPSVPHVTTQFKDLCHSRDWIKSITAIEPQNSALVPLRHIESYISSVLLTIGFSLCSKFLRLFMPYLQSKSWKHVAVRFLSQADTEKSSILEINPPPTKRTRITMLYKGLSNMDELVWGTSRIGLDNNPEVWKDIIAAESTTGIDRDVFSVYEITWMEIF